MKEDTGNSSNVSLEQLCEQGIMIELVLKNMPD